MKRRSVLRLAIHLLSVFAVIVTGTAPHTTHAQDASIFIVAGDSIAAGIGSSLPRTRGYAALVANWLEIGSDTSIILENLAVPGETAASFRTNGQLDGVVSSITTASEAGVAIRAISLSLGGNEMLRLDPMGLADRQEGLDEFRLEYRAALGAIRDAAGPDIPIVVTNYYDLTQGHADATYTDSWWIAQFNSAIRDAAAETGATVADLGPAFDGRIADFTHYPFDVHPTNGGHEVIARTVLASIGVAGDGPEIETISPLTTTRQTPTLRFQVTGEYDVTSVVVISDDVAVAGPFDAGQGEYVTLLRFEESETGEADAEVTITAIDLLGQEATTVVTVMRSTGEEGSP